MTNHINTFEGIRKTVIEQVEQLVQDKETYIVCDIYARFSVYVVDADSIVLDKVREKSNGYIDLVDNIGKGDFIYEELNHPEFRKPQKISADSNIYYVDRNRQLTNWGIANRYDSKSPIACFWSFKGGLGRTTALVLAGIHLARKGKKVVLMDFDLEAPGLASIFAYQEESIGKVRGVVDYLTDLLALKYEQTQLSLTDYYYTINHQDIIGSQGGEILLFPAGLIEGVENSYLSKLSKVTSAFIGQNHKFGIDYLFDQINK